MNLRAFVVAVLVLTGVSGCSIGRGTQGDGGSRNEITEGQIGRVDHQTLYEVVAALRPGWLRSRGPTSFVDPTPPVPSVYVDGQYVGTTESLRTMRPQDVRAVRYWNPGEAGVRFGMGHPRGVIEVMSRRGP